MPATNPDMPINDAVEHGIQAFLAHLCAAEHK
jgi:hypothetical protein